MGKTTLAATIGVHAAQHYAQTEGKDGAAIGLFSLEISVEPLGQRVLAEQSGFRAMRCAKARSSRGMSTA